MLLGTEVDLGPCNIVLDGDPASLTERCTALHFCGLRTLCPYKPPFGPCLLWPNGWWIRIPLGMEVGLGPGDIVLDGDPASPQKGAQQPPPTF